MKTYENAGFIIFQAQPFPPSLPDIMFHTFFNDLFDVYFILLSQYISVPQGQGDMFSLSGLGIF